MEYLVWLFNVLSAYITKSISSPLKPQLKPISNGVSNDVPTVSTPLTSNYSGNTCLVEVKRIRQTTDALFGVLSVDGKQVCYSMERTAVAIPIGEYTARMDISPHFGFATPHLSVPNRTYIEIHPANYVSQLEGCLAVGSSLDSDALDNSDRAFDSLVSLLPATEPFLVVVSSEIAS